MGRWKPIELRPRAILLEDADLVAVDKPSGVLSDASPDPDRDHLCAALGRWFGDGRFHAVHRLDRDTSGVVLFARSREAATALMHQFQGRAVTKRYQAVVGSPADGVWTAGTTFERRSHVRHRKGVTTEVRSGGKRAESRFQVTEVQGSLALVRAWPKTGRTHQLRVHLAAVGAPVLGDDRYGAGAAQRLWLHADTLALTHPATGQPLTLESRRALQIVNGHPVETERGD